MSRRPPYESPIPDFLQSENEEQARLAIGAASQEELDALEEAFNNLDIDGVNSKINQIETDVNNLETSVNGINNSITSINNELNQTIPTQRLMGNPGNTAVKPAPVDLDDGGLIIIGGKIQVGDTYGKLIFIDPARTDNKTGKGTIASPYNGSTPDRIDDIMKSLYDAKIPATVTFLPHPEIRMNMYRPHETFPVVPSGPFHKWYFYNGLHLKGCGKQRTVFKPAPLTNQAGDTTGSRLFFANSYKVGVANDIVYKGSISDCTFDAEVTGVTTDALPGPSLAYRLGWNLYAGEFTVENVEVINMGGRGQEMFPFTFINWPGGSYPDIDCNYLITRCSSNHMWCSSGIGLAVSGAPGSTAYQRCVVEKNYFEEMYFTWASFNNVKIKDNYFRNGLGVPNKSSYGNINYDTGISKGLEIVGNHLVDAIAGGVCVGSIILGNWHSKTLKVRLSDILIEGNTFELYPNAQQLWTPGVILTGNVHNWKIINNFYKPPFNASPFSRRAFVSNKGIGNADKPAFMDDGTTPVTDPNFGFGEAWNITKDFANTDPYPVIPGGGPQEANSEGIIFNNQLIDLVYPPPAPTTPPADPANPYGPNHGKTPIGMDNHLVSDFV